MDEWMWILLGAGLGLILAHLSAKPKPAPCYRIELHRDDPSRAPELVRRDEE